MKPIIVIATDGAISLSKESAGGWAAILQYGDHERILTGAQFHTTINEMEIMGAIEGVKALNRPCRVTIISDSNNLICRMVGEWKTRKPELCVLVDELTRLIKAGEHIVTYEKVKGHTGHVLNERADKLAVAAKHKLLEAL